MRRGKSLKASYHGVGAGRVRARKKALARSPAAQHLDFFDGFHETIGLTHVYSDTASCGRAKARHWLDVNLPLLLFPDDRVVHGLALAILSGSRGGSGFAVF